MSIGPSIYDQLGMECPHCHRGPDESLVAAREATDPWLKQPARDFPAEHMNDQQRNLHELLRIAQLDLEAGRPAERTAYALRSALGAAGWSDMTDGTADDQAWRGRRGLRG